MNFCLLRDRTAIFNQKYLKDYMETFVKGSVIIINNPSFIKYSFGSAETWNSEFASEYPCHTYRSS